MLSSGEAHAKNGENLSDNLGFTIVASGRIADELQGTSATDSLTAPPLIALHLIFCSIQILH